MIRDYTEKHINYKYREAKKRIEQTRDRYCASCGISSMPLDPSHLISRADCKRYNCVPLIWEPKNIQLHCRTCHHHWENGTEKGADFERNMEYISYLFTTNVIPKELYIKYLNRWEK